MKTILKKLIYLLIITFFIGCNTISEPKTNAKSEIIFVEGNIENAFKAAEKENKHLLIFNTFENYETVSDNFIANLIKNQEVNKELAENYLVYKCDMVDKGNYKLKRLFESIATPMGYIFTPNGKFLNFVQPTTHPSIIALSLKLERNGETSLLVRNSDRIKIVGSPAIAYYNEMITASNFVELGEKSESLKLFYSSLSQRKYNYFYYYYLMSKMATILEYDAEATYFKEKALEFNDAGSFIIFRDLINELKAIS